MTEVFICSIVCGGMLGFFWGYICGRCSVKICHHSFIAGGICHQCNKTVKDQLWADRNK
jgi:hypothetical protein